MKWIKSFTVLLISLVLLSCARDPVVSYGDAEAPETTSIGFGSSDLQAIAGAMVNELLDFPPVMNITAQGNRPVVFVDRIQNKTTEHIDTESITDTIQTKLLQSGRFQFVDMTAVKAIKDQIVFQLESGMVDPAKTVAFGRQTGAEYMLYGNLSSIEKRNSKVKDLYYKFTLKMVNLESGLMEWIGEKEIRKTAEKRFFSL